MGNGTRNNGCVMKILDGELIETLFDNNIKNLNSSHASQYFCIINKIYIYIIYICTYMANAI